jgi:hypothetical protein
MPAPLIIQGPGLRLPNRPSGWGYSTALAVPAGLVGYWTFDTDAILSSTTTADFSPSNTTGTLHGSPPLMQGQVGGALSFDGATQYVDLGASLDFFGGAAFSVAAWINIAVNVTAGNVISKGYDGTNTQWTMSTSGGTQKVNFGWSGGTVLTSNAMTVIGEWEHWVGTYDGTTSILYKNGIFDNSIASAGGLHTNQNAAIGAIFATGSPVQILSGSVDDVRVYNRALDPGEVMELYAAGLCGLRTSPFRMTAMAMPVLKVPPAPPPPVIFDVAGYVSNEW